MIKWDICISLFNLEQVLSKLVASFSKKIQTSWCSNTQGTCSSIRTLHPPTRTDISHILFCFSLVIPPAILWVLRLKMWWWWSWIIWLFNLYLSFNILFRSCFHYSPSPVLYHDMQTHSPKASGDPTGACFRRCRRPTFVTQYWNRILVTSG